jgi:hypothetical protein
VQVDKDEIFEIEPVLRLFFVIDLSVILHRSNVKAFLYGFICACSRLIKFNKY